MADEGDSDDLGAVLARAQAAVAALSRDYLTWARADIDACRRHLAAAEAEPERRREHLTALFNVAHNIKGQGSSFGYPLMTRLGQSLCQLTRETRSFGDAELALAETHLEAMDEVLRQEARDEGPAALQQRVAQIEAAVAVR
ncbi:MAG TPA: Hpt domain-containing protein [Dongiaceae bacterium]|nr:Hpt domain-containing protein [Dongiaceae bacterium]